MTNFLSPTLKPQGTGMGGADGGDVCGGVVYSYWLF